VLTITISCKTCKHKNKKHQEIPCETCFYPYINWESQEIGGCHGYKRAIKKQQAFRLKDKKN